MSVISVFYAGFMGLGFGVILSLCLLRITRTGPGFFILVNACVVGIALIGLAGTPTDKGVGPLSVRMAHWIWLGIMTAWVGTAGFVPVAWAQRLWWLVPTTAIVWWGTLIPHLPASPVGVWASAGTYLLTALLMGTVSTAMVLGHWYLVQPTLSIRALERMSLAYLTVAAGRLLWAIGWTVANWSRFHVLIDAWQLDTVFLFQRWGFSLLLSPILAWMVYRTAKIRSTQSATGILYAAMVVTLMGEFVGLYMWLHRGFMQ